MPQTDKFPPSYLGHAKYGAPYWAPKGLLADDIVISHIYYFFVHLDFPFLQYYEHINNQLVTAWDRRENTCSSSRGPEFRVQPYDDPKLTIWIAPSLLHRVDRALYQGNLVQVEHIYLDNWAYVTDHGFVRVDKLDFNTTNVCVCDNTTLMRNGCQCSGS